MFDVVDSIGIDLYEAELSKSFMVFSRIIAARNEHKINDSSVLLCGISETVEELPLENCVREMYRFLCNQARSRWERFGFLISWWFLRISLWTLREFMRKHTYELSTASNLLFQTSDRNLGKAAFYTIGQRMYAHNPWRLKSLCCMLIFVESWQSFEESAAQLDAFNRGSLECS